MLTLRGQHYRAIAELEMLDLRGKSETDPIILTKAALLLATLRSASSDRHSVVETFDIALEHSPVSEKAYFLLAKFYDSLLQKVLGSFSEVSLVTVVG